jgi:hypothetical protein
LIFLLQAPPMAVTLQFLITRKLFITFAFTVFASFARNTFKKHCKRRSFPQARLGP